mgnify:CR=1 FL=1
MLGKLPGWDDTIVALSTPAGIGAIAVIRLSGSNAIAIVNRLFPSKDLSAQPSHTLHVGFLRRGDMVIDEVVVALYKAPKSYTGEDVVELSCHGSPFIQQQIIEACIEQQARLAKPGEFTQRAFLNGKLDLAQAEAVADLIASQTEAARNTALHTMRGGFSRVLSGLREQLIKFSALIELELDFSQEDVEFADRSQLYELVEQAQDVTRKLIDSFRYGNVIKNGVQVAIVGRPNAGKSTLLNTFLNENRAIVSDIAGTTRDTIEEVLNIEGILFRLIDTAGIREHTSDAIERAGIDKSLEKIRQADLVLYVVDANEEDEQQLKASLKKYGMGFEETSSGVIVEENADAGGGGHAAPAQGGRSKDPSLEVGQEQEGAEIFSRAAREGAKIAEKIGIEKQYAEQDSQKISAKLILIGNKSDINGYGQAKERFKGFRDMIYVSAFSGDNVDQIKSRMVAAVMEGSVNAEDAVVSNARHYDALKIVASSLEDILKGLDSRLPGDLLALDIRRCLHYLGEITGEITNEDQLNWIFSKFCIGK